MFVHVVGSLIKVAKSTENLFSFALSGASLMQSKYPAVRLFNACINGRIAYTGQLAQEHGCSCL